MYMKSCEHGSEDQEPTSVIIQGLIGLDFQGSILYILCLRIERGRKGPTAQLHEAYKVEGAL